MSLNVRFGLFKRQTAPLLPISHYLEFTQKQEQLDFTQTHKLTVLCCVTPTVFPKIPPLMQRRRPCFDLSAALSSSGTLVNLSGIHFPGVHFSLPSWHSCKYSWYLPTCKHCFHPSSSPAPLASLSVF